MDDRYLGRFETEGFRGSDQEVELGEMRDVIIGKLPGEFTRCCSHSPFETDLSPQSRYVVYLDRRGVSTFGHT